MNKKRHISAMQNMSLPITLQRALQQHVAAADIEDDDELQNIMTGLSELNEKVQAVKERARLRKQEAP
jgi:hypothetical protein